MGSPEDYRTVLRLHENPLDEVRLQEEPGDEVGLQGEARLDENQGCSYSESGLKRKKRDEEVGNPLQEVQVGASNWRSMTDEGMNEGGDVLCSKEEIARNSEGGQGGARKPTRRKLYSETGNGPKILE